MVILHTNGRECFCCKKGKYNYFYEEEPLQKLGLGFYVLGKVKCNKCGHIIKEHLSEKDSIEINGVEMLLIEEELDVEMSCLSGNIDDVIKSVKELSLLYDSAYISLQFCQEQINGLRFETPLERGKRILAEKNNIEKEKQIRESLKDKIINEKKERYEFLKNKYANRKDIVNE